MGGNTIPYYCKFYEMERFAVVGMKFYPLYNICGCIIVLCGQTVLYWGIIAISLEKFRLINPQKP